MTDSELRKELFDLGLNENNFSIKLSSQFAYYHLRKGINCYEVFYQDERGGICDRREYKTEQLGKKALVDLVRMKKGIKAKYNTIHTIEKFNEEKARILSLLSKHQSSDKESKLYNTFYNLVSKADYKYYNSIQQLSENMIDYGFTIDRYISEELFYFVESIIIKE